MAIAEYTLHCFAQSGNACKAALLLELAGASGSPRFGDDWSTYPALCAWLARIAATPRWKHPYSLMPGHPRPAAA